MALDVFETHKSDRAERLFEAIRPYLREKQTYVDVGCGYGALAGHVSTLQPRRYFGFDFGVSAIERCSVLYPAYEWRIHKYVEGSVDFLPFAPDVMVHIGIDSWKYIPTYKIHLDLLEREGYAPSVVLLECGWSEGYPWPHESYAMARDAYIGEGYRTLASGAFPFKVDGHHLAERRFTVLGPGVGKAIPVDPLTRLWDTPEEDEAWKEL